MLCSTNFSSRTSPKMKQKESSLRKISLKSLRKSSILTRFLKSAKTPLQTKSNKHIENSRSNIIPKITTLLMLKQNLLKWEKLTKVFYKLKMPKMSMNLGSGAFSKTLKNRQTLSSIQKYKAKLPNKNKRVFKNKQMIIKMINNSDSSTVNLPVMKT